MRRRSAPKNAVASEAGQICPDAKGGLQERKTRKSYWSVTLKTVVVIVLIAVLLVVYLLITRFGFGVDAPVDDAFRAQVPLIPASALQVVVELPTPPGNLAVSSSGVVIFSFHPVYNSVNPTKIKIARVTTSGGFESWPSASFQKNLTSVLSIRIDATGRVWLLDHCEMGFLCRPTLYAFAGTDDADSGPIFVHHFPSQVAGVGFFLNDFQVDCRGDKGYIYITDTSTMGGTPALVVVDIGASRSYRLFHNHRSLHGESWFVKMGGVETRFGPIGFKTHVDGISLAGGYVYFSSVTSSQLYSISADAIIAVVLGMVDGKDSQSLIAQAAEKINLVSSSKPVSDGQSQDALGQVWLTAFAESALAVYRPSDSRLIKVIESPVLRWPDGLSFGPDGLYVTESALHLKLFGASSVSGATFEQAHGPFMIYRIPLSSLQQAFGPDYLLPVPGH